MDNIAIQVEVEQIKKRARHCPVSGPWFCGLYYPALFVNNSYQAKA